MSLRETAGVPLREVWRITQKNENRPMAGISISGPTSRMSNAGLPEFAAAIRKAAAHIAERYQTAASS